ncbi:NUDIX hydrolase [Iodobacter sp. LRB]|uniref:NUDIX hydrolase n=1 Tax=unclassified Iodobacter TaxID=235634 RepID=UPI000C108EA0|nr:NUDIX hydrolase [Iodobacter sp. BJB302]PHV03286.1 NUDIX hydrolase [Iodobacter sp. BJB302]
MWKPNATVAAVIEENGRFLLVEERIAGQLKLNQPAGHIEHGESIVEAAIRETLEETAHHFVPRSLIGVYQWSPPEQPRLTYLRFSFTGDLAGIAVGRVLDADIERAVWLTRDEIVARAEQHRSPLLLACIDDYLAGRRYPLDILRDFDR